MKGVSIRRVDGLVRALGVEGISKSQVSEMAKSLAAELAAFRARPLDARPTSTCESTPWPRAAAKAGAAHNAARVVATAVNSDGHRKIMGLDVFTSEDEAAWRAFLSDLAARGLAGVQLVISDDHRGLTNAIHALLPDAAWQ